MICEKCGKNFISRNLLLVHCCKIPIENNHNQKIIINEVVSGERSVLSLNYENPEQILQVSKPTLSELATVKFIDHCSDMGENNTACVRNYNIQNSPSSRETVFSSLNPIPNADEEIFEINKEGLPASSNAIFDVDLFDLDDDNGSNVACGLDQDDSDKDPNWYPEEDGSNRLARIIETCDSSTLGASNDISQNDAKDNIPETESRGSGSSDSSEEGQLGIGTHVIETTSRKRKRGVRKREEETKKKNLGLAYRNRKGVLCPAKEFKPITKCCTKKCFQNCTPEQQNMIWSSFNSKPPELRKQVLCDRMTLSKCKYQMKGRGTKGGKQHDRAITVTYSVHLDSQKIVVCKSFFINLYGITPNQLNLLVKKLKLSEDGFIKTDMRGQHVPFNKLVEERHEIRKFIDQYPRHESHYARRDNANQIFLPSHLTIRQMHKEYEEDRLKKGYMKYASYDVFRDVFNSTGYKFKQPYIDTCRKCDEYKALKKSATTEADKDKLNQLQDDHIKEANKAYESKRKDKEAAKDDETKRVLVFDLQQVLPAPYLSTNIVYYKRLLSVYNLTVRDCSSTESSVCFMWYEVTGGRGSDQIASCIFKKLMTLSETVQHVTTYSDTCGGQNRNINMAVMFLYAIQKKPSIETIDQKFLLPGHTRLECDSDHARIERCKKQISNDFKIMVPRDWFQFVRLLRGKSKFTVVDIGQEDFLAFSKLLGNLLVKRTSDTDGEKVSWLKIKWLRYTKEFGIIQFKYTLDDEAPFKTLDLRRGKRRGRPSLDIMTVPRSYSGPLGINPKKKKDLLSMLDLIDKDCHAFYENLPTTSNAKEYDELGGDTLDSDSDD